MSTQKVIGITGGIGSGKSMVCKIIESTGIPVYNSDLRAKSLYDRYPDLLQELKNSFGEDIFLSDGKLDRVALADLVFNDKSALSKLNALVHPRVRQDFEEWRELHSDRDILIKEAAILIESGGHEQCDEVWLVTAPEDIRIQRVIERDLVSRELVKQRMSNQWTDNKKLEYSDAEIVNDGKTLLIPQIDDLLNKNY